MSANYSKYYKAQLEEALLYQDFVIDAAWNLLGLAIVQYSSKAYQNAVGESRTGVEIKHDKKYARTGNLWIEVSEKAKPRPGDYVESGIMRQDNTWLYCIGDYDTILIFPKRFLIALSKSGRYKLIENNTKTSTGFLLPKADAEKYAVAILRPNASEKVSSFVNDINKLGEMLHQIAKEPDSQLSLFGYDDAA